MYFDSASGRDMSLWVALVVVALRTASQQHYVRQPHGGRGTNMKSSGPSTTVPMALRAGVERQYKLAQLLEPDALRWHIWCCDE